MDNIPRQLFDRYHLKVYRYFLAYVRQPIAEELSQEVFLKVVKGVQNYEPRGRDAAWVFTIARRVLLDFKRQQKRELVTVIGQEDGAEPRSESAETLKLSVREALTRLPEAQRDAFLLREVSGLSYAEIAAIHETTTVAVRSLLHRARQTLRSQLGGEHYGNGNRNHVSTIRKQR
jgi:RNA polymerase sigma-70 factor (ECF subfamily)